MKAMMSADRSDSRKPKTSAYHAIWRSTSGVNRRTCDRCLGRTGAALLRLGAAPLPAAACDDAAGCDLAEGDTFDLVSPSDRPTNNAIVDHDMGAALRGAITVIMFKPDADPKKGHGELVVQ